LIPQLVMSTTCLTEAAAGFHLSLADYLEARRQLGRWPETFTDLEAVDWTLALQAPDRAIAR
jgi:hypothetical protein